MKVEELKKEVGGILDRYKIPMDDKSFILDKIEGEIGTLAKTAATHVKSEREKDFAKMTDYEKKAKQAVYLTVKNAEEAVKKAHALGYKQGLGQAGGGAPTNWTTILLTVGLLGLGAFVIFREYFSRKGD